MDSKRIGLIVVDPQQDFCEDGSLAVPGGDAALRGVARHIGLHAGQYATVVLTRDWHIEPGSHFAPEGTTPDFITSWPAHCVAGTAGAKFHPAVSEVAIDHIVSKGQYGAAYSGFEGVDRFGQGLGAILSHEGVGEVVVCGIATDYCVKATAMDSVRAGFATAVDLALCAGVAEDTTRVAVVELSKMGVRVIGPERIVA